MNKEDWIMTKRIVSLFLVVVMAVSALYVTPTPSIAAQVHPDGTIDSVPIVKRSRAHV